MSTLYELTGEYLELLELIESGEADEQLLMDTLEGIDGEIEVKADGYAKIILELKASVEIIKQEEERLAARRKSREACALLLKNRLEENMRFIGKKKFKTDLFSFNIQQNGGLQPLQVSDNIEDIPMRFLVKPDPVPDNAAIREYLKDHEVEWAKLLPRGESLRIR